MTTDRIRWEPTKNGGFEGYVGTLEPSAFTIWKYRSDVAWWTLTGNLGAMRECPHGDDPEALKAEAERWLERFVSSLGAVFPEDEISDDEDDEPPEVTWAAGRRVRYAHPGNGYPGERERTADCLTLGAVYTVAWADIGRSRTDLNLTTVRGKPVGQFNSVFFEPADDEDGQ